MKKSIYCEYDNVHMWLYNLIPFIAGVSIAKEKINKT